MMRALVVALVLLAAACASAMKGAEGNPWWKLGGEPVIKVVNLLEQSCKVVVQSREGELRELGLVAPADSASWRLPFADQQVAVHICGATTVLDVDGPATWTLTARKPN